MKYMPEIRPQNSKKKVENKVLYKHLFSENLTEENKIQDIIEAFVIK